MKELRTPYLVRKDGTVVHRAAGHVIGSVSLRPGPSGGWVAETLGERVGTYGTRWFAAQKVWESAQPIDRGAE